MHRIDGPTVAAALPAPAAVVGTPGYFSNGNPTTSTPATVPTQDWFNTVQEELIGLVLAAGLTPDKSNHSQLLTALQTLFVSASGGVTGSVLAANGRRISADGYIEQWGVVPDAITSETSVPITFPYPFPNECFGIEGHIINSGASPTGNTVLQEVSVTKTVGTLFIQDQSATFGDAAGGFRWRARGH